MVNGALNIRVTAALTAEKHWSGVARFGAHRRNAHENLRIYTSLNELRQTIRQPVALIGTALTGTARTAGARQYGL